MSVDYLKQFIKAVAVSQSVNHSGLFTVGQLLQNDAWSFL